jgi:predicted  nucleic acid-binding Zn-ribbon protein
MLVNAKLIYALLIALALALVGASVQSYRLALEQKDHAKTVAKNEKEWAKLYASSATAAQELLARYQSQTESLQKEADNAKRQRDKAQADAVANADTGRRLRAELSAARARSCTTSKDPAAVDRSQAAGPAINLFDYVQRRLDEATDTVAEFADRSRIAGTACERSYDAVASP